MQNKNLTIGHGVDLSPDSKDPVGGFFMGRLRLTLLGHLVFWSKSSGCWFKVRFCVSFGFCVLGGKRRENTTQRVWSSLFSGSF